MNNKNNIKIKKWLGVLILLLITLPLIQQKTQLIKIKSLKGSYSKVKKPILSLENWFKY